MNIWVIGRSYPTRKNRMQGSFELEQAKLLSSFENNKISYIACAFHPFKKVKKWGFYSFKDENVNVYTESVPYFPERMYVNWKGFQKMIWNFLLKKVEREQGIPDIIHVHYPALVTISECILSYKEKGTKVVITEHWTKTLTDKMKPFQRKQLIDYVNYADAVVCVGKPLKESIKKITQTGREIEVVPNVVSEIFQRSKGKKEKESFDFIVVGRLVQDKQVAKIVQVFAERFKFNNSVSLMIVGNGDEKKYIEEIIRKYELSDRVKLLGTLQREQTARYVADADALICFSRLETFGVPVIEAWACGIPVIASDSLGFLEYWNDKLGYVVSADSELELGNAMMQILENKGKYDKNYIADYAKENFGELAIYKKLIEIYEAV